MSDNFTQEELSVLMVKQIYGIQKTLHGLKIGAAVILLTVAFDYLAHMGWFGPDFYLGALRMDHMPGGSAPISTPISLPGEAAALIPRVNKGGARASSAACAPSQEP